MKLLLKHNADVNAGDICSRTALHWAARNSHESVVELLLKNNADVNAEDYADQTALHSAAMNGHESVVELLLQNGANIEGRDRGGGTPLTNAIRSGSKAVINLLITRGAKVKLDYSFNTEVYGCCCRNRSSCYHTAHYAHGYGCHCHCDLTECPCGCIYDTVLSLAREKKDEAVVQLLLDAADIKEGIN